MDEIFSQGSQLSIMVKRRQIERNPNPAAKNDNDKYYIMSLLKINGFDGEINWLEACKTPFAGIIEIKYEEDKLLIHLSQGKLSIKIQNLHLEILDLSDPIPKIRHSSEE